jgi:NAD(P)-dependent dehydrogenase (short-subunit alcohol dehydrogenase family)
MSALNHQPLTALVTGATTGLGKEVTVRLARDDLQVVVVGCDAARGAAVVAQIEAAGGQARFIAADLSDQIKRLGVVCDASFVSDDKFNGRNGLTD